MNGGDKVRELARDLMHYGEIEFYRYDGAVLQGIMDMPCGWICMCRLRPEFRGPASRAAASTIGPEDAMQRLLHALITEFAKAAEVQ